MKLINFILPSLTAQLSKGHINAEELAQKIQNYSGSEGYYCLFHLEPRESLQGYRGYHEPALGYYVLDFDCSTSIDTARRDCQRAIAELHLEEKSFKIYFSGSKGFHLYIRQEFFQITPSDHTAKDFERLAVEIAKAHGLETLDDSIYQANRKFRLPNSRHPKTGLYKVELTKEQLDTLSIEEIQTLAKSPSGVSLSEYVTPSTKYARGNISVNSPKSVELSLASYGMDVAPEPNAFASFKGKPCITAMEATQHKEGMRHEVALALISEYFHRGESEETTTTAIRQYCILQGISERFDRDYLRAIKDIYTGKAPYTFGCYSKIKQKFCSGQCKLYTSLNPSKRAQVPDAPADKLPSAPHTSLGPTMTDGSGDSPIFPDTAKKGPLATIGNIKALLDFYNIQVGYNLVKKDIEIRIPDLALLKDNAKSNALVHIVSLANSHRLPRGGVEEFVEYLASDNPFNPAVRWITSQPWDGVSRLGAFYNTITGANDSVKESKQLKETLMRKWMLSAVAAAFSPNGSAGSGILVLQGAQYMGKTKWFKELVPSELEITKDGMMLDPKDKDSVYQCVTNWLVELGEVDATFRKADIAHLKAFLTKDTDVLRLAYSRKTSEFARRTVFFASVNQEDYLSDPTGNRRFWTIECSAINHTHGLPMQQVWAEVYELWKNGATHYLTTEEMVALNKHNENYQVKDAFEELFLERFDMESTHTNFMPTGEILRALGINSPTSRDFSRLKAVLKNLKIPAHKRVGVRGYFVCPVINPKDRFEEAPF